MRTKDIMSIPIIISILISGCVSDTPIVGKYYEPVKSNYEFHSAEVIYKIADLPPIDMQSAESFNQYKEFADNLNDLITLLNREDKVDIPKLKGTMEEYEKLSRIITEYGPLINNYNEVVEAANGYDPNNRESVNAFYIASGKLGLETTIIYYTVFSGPAYKITGHVYRKIGLNRLAFTCPTCVSLILKRAHWSLRAYLVESASEVADFVFRDLAKYTNTSLEFNKN